MDLLTIVIAYYNIKYFEDTLASLAAQTVKNFVVIIGNDNSPADPMAIIQRYSDQLNIDYTPFSANLGQTDLTLQWKRCIDKVKTPWFMMLGDDDMLDAQAVEGFYHSLTAHPQARVFRFDLQIVDENKQAITPLIAYRHILKATEFISLRAQNKVRSSLGEYVFRTTDYHRIGITSYPKAFYSDNRMVLSYADFGDITAVEQGYVRIRISNDSFSGNPQHAADLVKAGYQFYADLLMAYSHHFSKEQLVNFIPYAFAGMLQRQNTITYRQLFNIIDQNCGITSRLKYRLQYLKFKMLGK